MAGNLSIVNTIDKVISQSQDLYADYIKSDYIASDMFVDGVKTRGQIKDKSNAYTLREENTKMMTCELTIPVQRGSYIQLKKDRNDDDYLMKGIVTTYPVQTPVDFYFYTLFFNTVVTRIRNEEIYDEDGNVVSKNPVLTDTIDCFVQRIGMRERQVDAGIDSNSVNQLITIKKWDLKIDDILYIGPDRYIITDLYELDKDMLDARMTYYRY